MSTKLVMAASVGGRPRPGRCAWASVAIVAVGCALGAAVWAPSAVGSTMPSCSTANLRLDLVRTLGAAGARDWDFALRNVGSNTCQLKGYPRVALLDRSARLMDVTVGRGRGTVRAVVLRAWQRSFFTFHFESNGPCPSGIFPTGLQVAPPGITRRLRIYRPFGECAGDRPAVTPVRAKLGGV
jgi:Protein of unknown function (DUF4232)